MRRLNISAWAIRTPIPSVVMFIVLVILGVLSFRALPVERFPNIDFPLVVDHHHASRRLALRA